ncbi:hypothetical protein [Abyssisolibacter fermentans]|uniref:hypothetical protein n=1 Tax=Abyssisolibacter fermentans TaxID=1766203 RepID=UPI0008373EC0|nr:hypothetical protein [Abyssisolibacter fermentans]
MKVVYKRKQSLNQYVKMFEEIYEPIQNNERNFYQVLARLLESIAACSQFINKGYEKGLAENLPDVFSWFCSLIVKVDIKLDIEKALWKKFPNCCPYCLKKPCICTGERKNLEDNSSALQELSDCISDKPRTLDEWQSMFERIYPRNPDGYDQKSNFAHLIEELGETSESYRIRYFFPSAIESELADVFTWIMGIANLINAKAKANFIPGFSEYRLDEQVFSKYSGKCPNCNRIPCSCVISQAKQKISELNVMYPIDVMNKLDRVVAELDIRLDEKIKVLFRQPEAQNFLHELKNTINEKEINEEIVKDVISKLKDEEKHKKWYETLSLSGMAESGIVSIVTLLVQALYS